MVTTTATVTTHTSTGVTTTAPTVTNSGNPFSGYQLYANPYYSSEVVSLAIPSLTSSLAAKASAVAKVPSFVWL
jgi:cellulose 1,4-beta-cellobiosidase